MLRTAPLLFCLLGVACTGPDVRLAVTAVDSAGIQIVTNPSLDVPGWAMEPDPVLQLGTVDEEGPEQFFRVSAARRLSNGELAIHDGSREIRVFDEDGSWVRSFGREGEGPGEYRGPGRMFRLRGDTLAIWDTRLRRLTVLDYQGAVLRTISPMSIGRRPQILTVLPDGSTLFEDEIFLGYNPTEYTQQYSNFLLYGPDGQIRDSLPVQPRVEVALWGEGPLAGPRLFDEGTQLAGDWSGYWVATTKAPEIGRYSLSGVLEMLVRWPPDDRTVPDDASELSLAEQLASLGPGVDPEPLTRMHRNREVPALYPSHGPIVVDAVNHLWVQRFEPPGTLGPSEWRVFDPEGRLTATANIPRGHRIFDIGEDYVLALGRDEFDVEYIRLFRLTRS